MNTILSPAIALLSRMSYTRKFLLLWLVSLFAITVTAYSLFVSLDQIIRPSQLELEGIELIKPISRTVQFIQLHRGLSAALLGGNQTMRDRRAAKEREAAEAFKAMEGILPPGLTTSEDFRRIKTDWERLRKEGLNWTVDENFAAHTRLIEQIQLFEVFVADKYALTLDTEIPTFYLIDTTVSKLPRTLEHLGQLRAYGIGILARKQIAEQQKIKLNILIAELDDTLKDLKINLGKIDPYLSPALHDSTLVATGSIADSAQRIAGLVASDILAGRFATPANDFLDMATVEIDKSYTQLHESLLPVFEALVKERIAQAKKVFLTNVGIAALLLLVAVYFLAAIYHTIIGSIRSLIRSAHTFAEGDLTQRVKLATRDELSQIGDSFNRMADGFSALLEERKRAGDLLQSVIENAPVHIFWKDRDSRYLGCNTLFAKGAGYSAPEEITGKTDFEMGWKDYAESYRADDKAVMESGIPKLNYEEPFTTPDGNLAWAQTSKVPLRDESNRIIGILGIYQDITERKRAEKALMESRQQAQHYLDIAGVMLIALDAQGRVQMVNRKGCEMLGYPEADILGKNWFDNYLPEPEREKVVGIFALLMGGDIAFAEYHENGILTKGGDVLTVAWHNSILLDESGKVIGALSSGEDITARKQAEKSLLESKMLFSTTFDLAAVGIARVAPNGYWLDVNRRLCDIVGYTREELLARTFQDITHPDDLETDFGYVRQMLAGEIPTYSLEKRYIRKSGEIVWVNLSVALVRRNDGSPDYFISVVDDITERKLTEDSLRKLSLAVEQSPNSILITDIDAKIEYVNESFVRTSGYSRADLMGQNPRILHSGKNPKAIYDDLWAHLIRGEVWHGELINRRKDGSEYIEEEIISPVCQADGRVTHYLAIKEDITERRQAEQALIESRGRLHAVIESALDAVVQMDAKGIITGWNAQAEKVFGWTREEAIGRLMHETVIPPQYREAHQRGLQRFLSNGEGSVLNTRVEMTGLRRDGSEFPVELGITPIRAAGGYEFSGFIRDITERKKAEEAIWKEANFDALTGLPNRHMFYDRFAQELRKAERIRLPMALLYIDLDRFKEINDTLGHSMGDKVLVETARRIGACVREADTVARLGGDEFIIILTELGETTRIDTLAQNILNRLVEPFHLDGEALFLSASIGITLYPHDAAAMEELVKNADQAMYAAKNTGRNRFSYFTLSMQEAAQNRMRLTSDLRGALAAGQFRLHYQPIVDLLTGRIHKAEALIRWQHPLRGPVSPIEFIPLAEETGLILEIGDWVFREAAHQAKRWRAHYDPEFQVSLNMSPAQFRGSGSPCRAWPAYLRKAGLPGQSLVIEITEGLLLEKEQGVIDRLLQFHEAGVQISLDDFGTGYSSLSYLQKFDIDYLKIDQSFTRKLEPGSGNMALSEAIIVMAHRLGMKVIAEGVETEAQRDLLAAAGCNYGQGYLFSRPVPAEEFEELLKGAVTRDSQAH